jgi:hypothetical protein
MSKSFPRYCKNCKWYRYNSQYGTHTLCDNPILNSKNPDSLSSTLPGVLCKPERSKKYFGLCGIKGKLWEVKENVKDFKEGVQSSDC